MGPGSTSVIQITNIAPTVTNEQLRALIAFVGAVKEFVVYPSNDPSQQISRVCYVRFIDPMSVSVAQHLTNTVFIDRAIFVKPISDNKIPDEIMALKLANEGHSQNSSNSGVVSQIATVNGIQSITTIDPRLNALGLPQYPPLSANLDPSKIEEIRRTISITNVSKITSPEDLLEFFNQFGEVKFLRMTSNENDIIKSALIEFTDQSSVANALQNTGIILNGSQLNINHSQTNILKPQCKFTETDRYDSRESKSKRARDGSRSPSYRRSRSPRRRSRSPVRSRDRRRSPSGSRSPVRDRRRRSRSRERRRSVDRRRSRSRSPGSRLESSSSRSRDKRRDRDRSKDRDRRNSRDKSVERHRSYDRDRRRDRDKHRERSKDRERSRKRDRSRESDRKDKHRSKKDRRRSRSSSKSKYSSSKNGQKEKLEIENENIPKEGSDFGGDGKSIGATITSAIAGSPSSKSTSPPRKHYSDSDAE